MRRSRRATFCSRCKKIEARGAIESAHKIKQLWGQVFRYAVAAGLADRDVTADLRDALSSVKEKHYAALIERYWRNGST